FRPVFNFADFSISVGVAMIILYQKRFFGKKETDSNPKTDTNDTDPAPEAGSATTP
ncbi:MAG: hypothetical protein H0X46_10245, partial [Bacteroidetes bacterium]|nr:hypothetical protein [Bacteroidota bacterium]